MFWRFGGYANISTIDTILDKPDFTLEELLDESDLIQELKQHNSKLIEYLRSDKVLDNLLDYVVAPKLETVESPDESTTEETKAKNRFSFSRPRASSRSTDPGNDEEEEQEKKRNRYAFIACEILSSDTWSIYEALADNRQLIRDFWNFLSRPAPLDPLQASYFTKVNESLFEKKTEEMMELLTSLPDAVPNLLKHVECPMVMDLLLKIIALDRNEGGQGVVEWLYSKDIIPSLLSCLSPENNWVVQTAAGDFIKAIITISANASQNEQQCIGPNELTRQLVSKPCVEQLVSYMLGGGNPLTVGVGIIIEVIRKNNSDYDPDMGTESTAAPSSRDPIYLGTLLRIFAENVPKFMSLIMDVPSKKDKIDSTFGVKLEPLGFDRFKTCELMAELLHCSNMGLLNEPGSEQLTAQRDVERQRLRNEGKLGPVKDEDHSADDLTMRTPAPEEKRRLEVTNADDDGFEEVEPSKEMSEDTSHEFVKAEDDIPVVSTTPISGKDEDDFVDEPLSPPQQLAKAEETRFDEPDLMVAPLSPTKAKTETAEPAKPDTDKPLPEVPSDEKADEKKPEAPKEDAPKEDIPKEDTSDSSAVLTLAPSEPETKTDLDAPKGDEAQPRGLSPQPEDTPAPLFSAPPAPESGADRPPQVPEKDEPKDAPQTEEASTETKTEEAKPEEQPPAQTEEPVVGDFLKLQFVEHRVVPTILNFFFTYPWNNFLHNVVYDIVQQVFNGPMDRSYNPTLAVSLFETADVTSAIINGQKISDESQAKTKTRMGYMGHLTLIAEEVVKFTERHPPELLSEVVLDRVMSQEWISYVEGSLAETRERDNAILGGVRPEVAMGNRAMGGGSGLGGVGLSGLSGGSGGGGSNALAEAGLNGGIELNQDSGNGIGPFTISAGTLMSGFGSSSDEEDEDGDGDEEDVNSEVSGASAEDGEERGIPGYPGITETLEDVIMRSPEPFRAESPDFEDLQDITRGSPMDLDGVRRGDEERQSAEQVEDISTEGQDMSKPGHKDISTSEDSKPEGHP
ncbi:SIT4 phosphatase-associated protein-domain-containing protein [Fusarium flagelliforme]|uniref:SIT4 phosphatase-associated protein-domain-containing protein n=1 Tax=Fusarium flagelliforme TaxID=2675880 RepID=UPI001E8CD704|nr:SIT4 phosphatase-associated protein-domain-containing protein [Fusarium flagelliforme]KAH7193868.1 SIT4 phosphatase-associated protein-domain-containing protein [Fusarium flagelliforme]